jgi:hypothetical protein
MKCQANVVAMAMVVVASTPNASIVAKKPLAIRVSPTVSFPTHLVVRIRIEPDAFNRAVEMFADSDQFYRSSLVQLDGEQAPRASIFQFRSLPTGEYEVKALLMGADGHARAIVRAHVNVVESAALR